MNYAMAHFRPANLTLPIAALLAFVAGGAQPGTPKTDPTLSDPRLTDPKPANYPPAGEEPPAVDPTPQPQPQFTPPTILPPAGPALLGADMVARIPEGSLVVDLHGTLHLAETGDAILIPPAGSKNTLAILLPSQRLAQMIASHTAHGQGAKFIVSGQVYVYRDRPYLLPTLFAVEPTPTANGASPGQDTPPADASARRPAAAAQNDPRVADLLSDLESQRMAPRRVASPVAIPPAPNAPQAPQGTTPVMPPAQQSGSAKVELAEGTMLTLRRGRLTRLISEGGRLAFTPDNDPDSPAHPPLILQPSRVLERMEQYASSHGDDAAFRVSGRVMTCNGKSYLLPVFFQMTPRTDVRPLQ